MNSNIHSITSLPEAFNWLTDTALASGVTTVGTTGTISALAYIGHMMHQQPWLQDADWNTQEPVMDVFSLAISGSATAKVSDNLVVLVEALHRAMMEYNPCAVPQALIHAAASCAGVSDLIEFVEDREGDLYLIGLPGLVERHGVAIHAKLVGPATLAQEPEQDREEFVTEVRADA